MSSVRCKYGVRETGCVKFAHSLRTEGCLRSLLWTFRCVFFVCVCVSWCGCKRMCARPCVRLCVGACVCASVCVYECVCVYMSVCVCVLPPVCGGGPTAGRGCRSRLDRKHRAPWQGWSSQTLSQIQHPPNEHTHTVIVSLSLSLSLCLPLSLSLSVSLSLSPPPGLVFSPETRGGTLSGTHSLMTASAPGRGKMMCTQKRPRRPCSRSSHPGQRLMRSL